MIHLTSLTTTPVWRRTLVGSMKVACQGCLVLFEASDPSDVPILSQSIVPIFISSLDPCAASLDPSSFPGYIQCPVPSPFPGLVPSIVPSNISNCLSSLTPCSVPSSALSISPKYISTPNLMDHSLNSITSSAPVTTLMHIGFVFVLFVYVILLRITGVCC